MASTAVQGTLPRYFLKWAQTRLQTKSSPTSGVSHTDISSADNWPDWPGHTDCYLVWSERPPSQAASTVCIDVLHCTNSDACNWSTAQFSWFPTRTPSKLPSTAHCSLQNVRWTSIETISATFTCAAAQILFVAQKAPNIRENTLHGCLLSTFPQTFSEFLSFRFPIGRPEEVQAYQRQLGGSRRCNQLVAAERAGRRLPRQQLWPEPEALLERHRQQGGQGNG